MWRTTGGGAADEEGFPGATGCPSPADVSRVCAWGKAGLTHTESRSEPCPPPQMI